MATIHSAAVRNAQANVVLDAIDQDAGAGNLVFRTAGDVEVATLALTDPAGTVTAAVLTFSAISDDTNATGGTTTKATIEDNSGDIAVSCSVAASGGDITISSTAIGAGDTVSCSSLTYTAAP